MTDEFDQVAAKLRTIEKELGDLFFERQGVVRALLVAMLAGEHSLLIGPPGTAKSELARELTSRFDGARFWEILLSKFTDPKAIFGPIDVAALTQGKYVQMLDGRATTANVAFIDEIFKCSPAALNAMLALLNERLYHPESGGDPIHCPLISAVTASNELPSGDELSAIYDRLMVRVEVGYLADQNHFAGLLRSAVATSAPASRTTVDLTDLQAVVTKAVPAVKIPDGVVDAICALRASLRRKEHIVSDRRWKKAVRLIQAAAFLDGRSVATTSDMEILTCVLWESVADRPAIEREVLELTNPYAREAVDIADAIEELNLAIDAKKGQAIEKTEIWAIKEARPKLRQSSDRLKELVKKAEAEGRPTATLHRVADRCAEVTDRLNREVLGL
jgi:MoxR-like ATPase